MNTLNAILTAAADAIFSRLAGWPPVVTLVAVSLLAGVVMAVAFRFTSRQKALRRVTELSRAQVLAIKLFRDDLGTMFDCLGELLRYTGLRILHSVPPMLVMGVPFVLLLTQLARWYECLPLVPGETAVVELQSTESAWAQCRDAELEAPPGVEIETRPLRDEQKHAVYWRIRVVGASPGVLRCRVGSAEFEKELSVAATGGTFCPVDVRRAGPGFFDRVLYPGEPGIAAAAPVCGITVHHARRSTPLFGFDVPWWLTFILFSILAALAIRPVVKVSF